MPSLDLNGDNAADSITIVTAAPPQSKSYDGQVVFAADAHAILALPPLSAQDIDAVYGRGLNAGGELSWRRRGWRPRSCGHCWLD